MRYKYVIEKPNEYIITCPDFPSISAKDKTEDIAFSRLLTCIFVEIRKCLIENRLVPDTPASNDDQSFGLPLNMTLKLRLHNIRLKKGVSKAELARFLALTYEDVGDCEWDINTLRCLQKQAKPKYKKVQRLFSIDHESTIREVEQAYRVLGYTVDAIPIERRQH